MKMIFDILSVIAETFIYLYVFANVIYSIRNKKYQKLWDKEKAMRLRSKPAISRADLCEQYVMFCKRNSCNVEFKDE